jgi:hypothetical protein
VKVVKVGEEGSGWNIGDVEQRRKGKKEKEQKK